MELGAAIRFLRFAGSRVAFAVSGEGPPQVAAAWWVSHVELNWGDEAFRSFWGSTAAGRALVRYDRCPLLPDPRPRRAPRDAAATAPNGARCGSHGRRFRPPSTGPCGTTGASRRRRLRPPRSATGERPAQRVRRQAVRQRTAPGGVKPLVRARGVEQLCEEAARTAMSSSTVPGLQHIPLSLAHVEAP